MIAKETIAVLLNENESKPARDFEYLIKLFVGFHSSILRVSD